MKKITILFLFFIALFSYSALAAWVFDTDVDLATPWSQSGGGAINNGANMHDSNMASYAYWTGGEWIKAGYYYNNTKPAYATGAKIQLKWKEPAVTENYTYPLTCFNAHSTFITYVIYGYNSNDNNWRFMVQCVNATTDIGGVHKEPFPVPPVITYYYKPTNANFYEVDIYWNVNTAPSTPTSIELTNPIYVGNTLNASCKGSVDAEGSPITDYYKFYNVNHSAIRQAYSTTPTYTIATTDAHDKIRVYCISGDGVLNSSEYTADRDVKNSLPTTPSGSSLNAADEDGEELIVTGAGSTDTDTDTVSYKVEFKCTNPVSTLQALSTDNSYVITSACDTSIDTNIYSFDGINTSTSYETKNRVIQAKFKILNNTYDMTSDGNCTTWRKGNESLYCQTTDGTPNIYLHTTTNSNFSISNVSTMKSYSKTSRCATTGLTTHLCTLPISMKLKPGIKTLYIAGNSITSINVNQSAGLNINLTITGGLGAGLISCIGAIGSGCGISIANNCAAISK